MKAIVNAGLIIAQIGIAVAITAIHVYIAVAAWTWWTA
jgi:hypothetical protein